MCQCLTKTITHINVTSMGFTTLYKCLNNTNYSSLLFIRQLVYRLPTKVALHNPWMITCMFILSPLEWVEFKSIVLPFHARVIYQCWQQLAFIIQNLLPNKWAIWRVNCDNLCSRSYLFVCTNLSMCTMLYVVEC